MRKLRTGFLGRKSWTLVMAFCLLTLLLAPMSVNGATRFSKSTPSPAQNQTPVSNPSPILNQNATLDQILDSLPNGVPFQLLAQAIQFVEGQVSELITGFNTLQNTVTQLQNQVNALQAQVGQSLTLNSGFGTSAILSNQAPGTEHVRLEVSFVPTSGTPPAAGTSFIMYAVVSVETLTEINFISAGNNGLQAANIATVSATPSILASIGGLADLVAVTGTGGVTFQIHELGVTAGTYFVKVTK